MEREEAMKLKEGDEVVVKVANIIKDEDYVYPISLYDGVTGVAYVAPEAIVKKVKDNIPKIELTQEQADELNYLRSRYASVSASLYKVYSNPDKYPQLYNLLYNNVTANEDSEAQLGFALLWEHKAEMKLIQVPKYYIHLVAGDEGYLRMFLDEQGKFDHFDLGSVKGAKMHGFQVKFTDEEIQNMTNDLVFTIEDNMLEKVEDS